MKVILRFFVVLSLLFTFSSCKENGPDLLADVKGNYFSIKHYILDEWSTHAGEPITFKRTLKVNGKTDSSFQSAEQVDWVPLIKTFSETEISDRKYLGMYKFSQYDDDFDNTHNFIYIAGNKDLFTQKLLITIDINTMKVRGIYIETFKSTFFNECTQKLYYNPGKIIQVQQYDNPKLGSKKEMVLKYESQA